jgi:hypothetical protein
MDECVGKLVEPDDVEEIRGIAAKRPALVFNRLYKDSALTGLRVILAQ